MKYIIAAEVALVTISSVAAGYSGYAGVAVAVWTAMILTLTVWAETNIHRTENPAVQVQQILKQKEVNRNAGEEIRVTETREQLIQVWKSIKI